MPGAVIFVNFTVLKSKGGTLGKKIFQKKILLLELRETQSKLEILMSNFFPPVRTPGTWNNFANFDLYSICFIRAVVIP